MDKRILLLITDLEIGGTPTVVRELAVRLDRHPGAWVEVACLGRWGPVADELRDHSVPVQALNARSRADLSVIYRLARLIDGHKIDTVLSFLIHANAAAAAASVFCTKPVYLQSIQTTQLLPKWHWQLQRAAHRAAEKIVVPSPSVADVAGRWSDVPERKIVVIPNAVEPRDFSDLRRKSNEGHRIGFIGRLDPIKRIGDLVSALTQLDANITLDIFGKGSEQAAIEAQVEQLNLRQRVRLHGAVAGPRDALREIDLLVLPSQAEGFGLVLIEAMAAGIPVVGTDVPGIRDVIIHKQNGLLMPVANPTHLAKAIQEIFSNSALRASLVAGGLATVKERFTWQIIFPQYLNLLDLK